MSDLNASTEEAAREALDKLHRFSFGHVGEIERADIAGLVTIISDALPARAVVESPTEGNGSCWDEGPTLRVPSGECAPMPPRCELRAGHLGAHKGGRAEWMTRGPVESPTDEDREALTRFDDADALREYLIEENISGTADGVVVRVGGNVWLAYCTDPDGEWFFESGDPEERMIEDAEGWREYERVGFDFLGPQIDNHGAELIWPRRVSVPPTEDEAADLDAVIQRHWVATPGEFRDALFAAGYRRLPVPTEEKNP